MPFNGSGVFTPPGASFPAVPNTTITSNSYNSVINDIATGLSNAMTRNGQSPALANIPMGGFVFTGLGNGTLPIPALGFAGNDGIYRPSANVLGIGINGLQVATFDANGLNAVVGGTTAKAGTFTTLTVSGGFNANSSAAVAQGLTVGNGIAVSNGAIITAPNFPLTLNSLTGTAEKILFQDAGALRSYIGASLNTALFVTNAADTIRVFVIDNSGNSSCTGSLGVNTNSVSNSAGTLTVTNTGTQGASITLAGNGATTPNKTFRAVNGVLQMVNSAYSASVLSIDDGGGIATSSGVTAAGAVNGAALYAGPPRSENDLISLSTSAAGQTTFRWYQGTIKEWAMGMSSGSTNLNIFENNGLGTVSFTFGNGGNFVAAGNVSGVSDERIKTNWRAVQPNFLEALATIKSGIYDRTDCVMTQAGVSAQDIQRILPEVVQVDEDGRLSLAYGNAAMVSIVELTKRFLVVEARLASMA